MPSGRTKVKLASKAARSKTARSAGRRYVVHRMKRHRVVLIAAGFTALVLSGAIVVWLSAGKQGDVPADQPPLDRPQPVT